MVELVTLDDGRDGHHWMVVEMVTLDDGRDGYIR